MTANVGPEQCSTNHSRYRGPKRSEFWGSLDADWKGFEMLHVSFALAPLCGAPAPGPRPRTTFTAGRVLRRVAAVLLTAPLVGLLVGAMPSAQAAPNPRLTITDVTLNRTSVAVSGLNTVPIGVTVKGGYKSSEPGDLDLTLNVVLERTSGTGPLRTIASTDLKLTAGTLDNGTWTGPLYATSTANGTYKVTGVMTGPYWEPVYGTPVDPTPFDGQTVTITGTHLPKITASVSPKVVPFGSPYSIRWAVTDSATGKPYGTRIPVGWGSPSTTCVSSTRSGSWSGPTRTGS